jgi:ATP-dependent DNA helicase RecQ
MRAADTAEISGGEISNGLNRLGYESFRPGQREALETLLARDKLLLVAPTGGGKSLIYQLPALLLSGTSLVISPLISLMHDQVHALESRGIPATFLASTLDSREIRRRMAAMANGEYKLVYVAPERLGFPGFRGLIADLGAPLVAVDEAHCISEWGHDFRPEYLQIGELIRALPRARVLACTATATPIVRDEILARLGLGAETPQIVQGFARPNLGLRVEEVVGKRDRQRQVDALLAEALGHPGSERGTAIVYAPTRKSSEQEFARLREAGWRGAAYHAGLPADVRNAVHLEFARGELELVIATNAFGMGIDRPDVRCVIHLAPPSSLESYYQEVGRAGRDGNPALGLLLIAPGDLGLRRSLIERGNAETPPDPEVLEHKWNLFLELMRWAEGGSCRHDGILRYFGDEAETLDGCGRCDTCQALSEDAEQDSEEASTIVRKALSAAARVNGRFGLQLAAKLLRGDDDERLTRTGLDQTSTFGCLREHSFDWLVRLLRRCVTAGWIDFHGQDRPVIALTDPGRAVMHGHQPARMILPSRLRPRTPVEPRSRRGSRSRKPDEVGLDAAALALFEALRSYRLELSRKKGVPPYVVASDRALRELAQLRPKTLDDLQLAHGIGPAKAKKYGTGLLQVVANHRD